MFNDHKVLTTWTGSKQDVVIQLNIWDLPEKFHERYKKQTKAKRTVSAEIFTKNLMRQTFDGGRGYITEMGGVIYNGRGYIFKKRLLAFLPTLFVFSRLQNETDFIYFRYFQIQFIKNKVLKNKLIWKYFNLIGRLLIMDQLSSPEPLSAGGWSQRLLRRRQAEDGPWRLNREDEVDVGDHHGETRQEGESKTETSNTAAEGCGHPVNQPAERKQTHLYIKV